MREDTDTLVKLATPGTPGRAAMGVGAQASNGLALASCACGNLTTECCSGAAQETSSTAKKEAANLAKRHWPPPAMTVIVLWHHHSREPSSFMPTVVYRRYDCSFAI